MRTDFALSSEAEKNVRRWLNDSYDDATKKEIRTLLQTDVQQVEESFYTTLSFGTGGIRGLMGIGSNRINIYTIRELTQGLVQYIKQQGIDSPKIVIGYDTRKNSRLFAEQAAKTAVSNGFEAFVFDVCCPTPLLSFAVRKLKCHAGIMITASHNPPEYNGYKVYWSDGAQVLPPHDIGISKAIEEIRSHGLFKIAFQEDAVYEGIGEKIFQSYLQEIKKIMLWPSCEGKKEIKILYTSLHGTGGVIMKEAFHAFGMYHVGFVEPQMVMDGNFPTIKIPNPEMPQALSLGRDMLLKEGYDLLLATDPDADRVGLVVSHHGKAHTLSGNQIAALLAEWILRRLYEAGRMPPRPALIKSIVTTQLLKQIAQYWNVACFDVLTGFKYIAEKIRLWEDDKKDGYSFVFGGEESLGFLYGTQSRDKDGILSSCVLAEIAAFCKQHHKTLVDALHDIWKKYGIFAERVHNVAFNETKEGKARMKECMDRIRTTPPTFFGDKKVEAFEDLLHKKRSGERGAWIAQSLPFADVLLFHLKGGGLLCVRPSGTEPKVKIYAMLSGPYTDEKNSEHSLDEELRLLISEASSFIN